MASQLANTHTKQTEALSLFAKPGNHKAVGEIQHRESPLEILEKEQAWNKVEAYLQPWLDERKQLIHAWNRTINNVLQEKAYELAVERLCEILMDYISAGHFEIYEKLLEESRLFNDGFLSLAEPLYDLIGHSTEQALKFNEQYSTRKRCRLKKRQLPFELSKLGQSLEERFEAEDQLVKFLHQMHSQ